MVGNSIQNFRRDIIVSQDDRVFLPFEFLDAADDGMNALTMLKRILAQGLPTLIGFNFSYNCSAVIIGLTGRPLHGPAAQ